MRDDRPPASDSLVARSGLGVHPEPEAPAPRKLPPLLYLIIAAAVALILAWGAAEKGPPRWDDSWYLAAAVRLFDRFGDAGLPGYWSGFQHALGDKAPLITVLPFPFFCLIGRSVYVIYLVNAAGCILLAVALYSLVRQFFEQRAALLAVLLALTTPLLAGLSRLFLPEYWLTTFVVAVLALLAQWERTERLRWLFWMGAVCGLGLLMKITFPAFVAPVIAVALWRHRSKGWFRVVTAIFVIALPMLALAGPWYLENWRSVIGRSFQETYFMPVHPTEKQSPAAMALDYAQMVANYGLSPVHVLAALAGLIAWVAGRRENFLRGAARYVVPWMILLPVFAVSENRDLRLIAPMMPAFAIAIAALLDCLLSRIGRAPLLVAIAAAAAILITLNNGFAIFGARDVRLGPWLVVASTQGYAFPPNPERWPLGEVLDRVAHRERLGPGSKLIVGIGADTWSFNSNNLELAAALRKYPIDFHTTAYTAGTDSIHRIMSQTQYFFWKDGGTQQPPDRFRSGPRTIDYLLHGPLFREVEPAVATPDGGRVRIFENAGAGPDVFVPAQQPATPPSLDAVDLNFGDFLRVTGLRATVRDGLVTLQLRWRCMRPIPAPHRAFAHVIDGNDEILGSMDHEIAHASPPVSAWQPGDEAYEARYLALPAASTGNTRLKIGIFDPETGDRVPLWTSTLPLKDDFTAAVIEPNQTPGATPVFQLGPAPLAAANVEFDGGLRLTGYSVRRSGGVVWLRLRWTIPRRPSNRLRFFGHAVADRGREPQILLSFDQDLRLERMPPPREGGPLELTQDIVRDVAKLSGTPQWIRAGVFDLAKPNDRVSIRSSSVDSDRQQKAIFLPWPADEAR